VLVFALAITVTVTVVVTHNGSTRSGATAKRNGASYPGAKYAHAFLHRWVAADGRVVRRDQGGDTVSEGQAYGMLLALAVRDRKEFDTIWRWTKVHLQNPNGSLASSWRDGHVVDPMPASDADVDSAIALLRAAGRWHRRALRTAGDRIATATLRASTIRTRPGRLLTAGPWATGRGGGQVEIAPDYLVAGTAVQLAVRTGRSTWRQVAAGTAVMDTTLIHDTALPPDWVVAPSGAGSRASEVKPAGAPDGSNGPRYGLSAPRLLIRLAASCRAGDRALAARASDASVRADAPAIRGLDGSARVDWKHPVSSVAAAAVQTARGNTAAARSALARAEDQQRHTPTYYGAAWVALGYALLHRGVLGSCAGKGVS
jgi:endoglucanase